MRYKSPECCIWKCLLFALFPLSHFQWWVVHSSLGTMEQYNNLRGGTISQTEETPPLAPSLTRSTSYVHSIRAWKMMPAFSRVPDAGGDWPVRKPWMNLVLSSLWLFLMPFSLTCRLSEVQSYFLTATIHFNPWLVLSPSLPASWILSIQCGLAKNPAHLHWDAFLDWTFNIIAFSRYF